MRFCHDDYPNRETGNGESFTDGHDGLIRRWLWHHDW